MLEANGGLESISSFLTAASTKASTAASTEDETFFKNNLKSCMKIFDRERERVLRILIVTLNSLSQCDELFAQKSQELNLIEIVFKLIKKQH